MSEFIRTCNKITARWWARIIIFIALNFAILTASLLIYGQNINFEDVFVIVFFTIICSSILIEILRKDGMWFTFGVKLDINALRDFFYGLAIVLFSLAIIILTGIALSAEFTMMPSPSIEALAVFTISIFFGSFSEELIYRGIIFQALIERFNPYIVIFLTSLLFAVGHLLNPNASLPALFNIFIANILMSAMYIRTLSLWMPVSFHFFWNWCQQLFLGSPVSGYDFGIRIFDLNTGFIDESYLWIVGNNFGIEEGFITTIILLSAIPLVIKYASVSPYMAAQIFKRNYSESALVS